MLHSAMTTVMFILLTIDLSLRIELLLVTLVSGSFHALGDHSLEFLGYS